MAPKVERAKETRRAAMRRALDRALVWGRWALVAATVFFAVWGSLEIRSRVRAEPRFDLSRWKLELGELPPWAPEEMREEVGSLDLGSGEGGTVSVFTPRVLDVLRRRLLASSWVRSVPELHLRYPGFHDRRGSILPQAHLDAPLDAPLDATAAQIAGGDEAEDAGGIELEIELRVPIAAVAAGGSCYLADREGVRLGPAQGAERALRLGIPAIVGGEGRGPRRPPPPGAAWEDRDVREGLEVARVLQESGIREEFPDAPIESIDISNVGERARAGACEVILVAGGLRLGWGRSPISPGARTLSVTEILENLRQVLRNRRALSPTGLVLLYTSPLVVAEGTASRS